MSGLVYMIREREFSRLNENTYKIGKTSRDLNSRMSGYPKGSEVCLFVNVKNYDVIEKIMIKKFKKKFVQKKEYGTEYFNGNPELMKNVINKIIEKYDAKNQNCNINNDINIDENNIKTINDNKLNIVKRKPIDTLLKECKKCNYKTNDYSNWNRHLKTKLHIKKTNHKILEKKNEESICEYCKKKYATLYTLKRHYDVCKKIISKNNDSKKMEKLEKENNKLKEELKIQALKIENKFQKKIIKSKNKEIKSKNKEIEFINKLIISAEI